MQIGNAVINDETDIKGTYDHLASHVFASDLEASQIQKYCGFSPNASRQSPECTAAIDAVEEDIANGLDLYNIYAPICFPKGDTVQHLEASVSANFVFFLVIKMCLRKKSKHHRYIYRR
jgi:serine carboxypeptidase-like clade 2